MQIHMYLQRNICSKGNRQISGHFSLDMPRNKYFLLLVLKLTDEENFHLTRFLISVFSEV